MRVRVPSFWALRVREQPTEVESFAFAGIRPNATRPYNWKNMRALCNIKAESAGLVPEKKKKHFVNERETEERYLHFQGRISKLV